MIFRILDTDHVSLLERKDTLVVDKFSRSPVGKTAITINHYLGGTNAWPSECN